MYLKYLHKDLMLTTLLKLSKVKALPQSQRHPTDYLIPESGDCILTTITVWQIGSAAMVEWQDVLFFFFLKKKKER